MADFPCPGLPGSWLNGWLAAVGATVLDHRLRLRWTLEGTPTAVLSANEEDAVDLLRESWPTSDDIAALPIAPKWRDTPLFPRRVSLRSYRARAEAARSHPTVWTLSSTVTDLAVDKTGQVAHAPFDPAGPGPIGSLHDRLTKLHRHVPAPSADRIRDTLAGRSERVQDNGLGFDQSRLGSLADHSGKFVEPIIEILAFFGLALLPVRGQGQDQTLGHMRSQCLQRGWSAARRQGMGFSWPAWTQDLDHFGIDALLDAWAPHRKATWVELGVLGGWRTVRLAPRASADPTRAYGSELL